MCSFYEWLLLGRRQLSSTLGLSFALLLIAGFTEFAEAETISGRVFQQIIDYSDHSSDTVHYLELKSGESIRLDLSAVPTLRPASLATGSELVVSGEFSPGAEIVFRVTDIASFQAAPAIAADDTVGGQVLSGTRRAVIIKLNLQSAGATYATVPCSTATISNAVYDAPQSTQRIYETSSRNQLTFNRDTDANGSVDVFGPFTINGTPGVCDNNSWSAQADAAAAAAGVVLSLYQHKIYVLPNAESIGCPWLGRAEVACGNSCRAWIARCDNIIVYTHEIGHNFGLWHAATDSNNDGVPEDAYGDTSCPMGAATLKTYLFNAPHQDQLGWFDSYPGKIVTVASNGNYSLSPLERDSSAAPHPQMLKIAAGNQDSYYLSFRRRELPIDQLGVNYADKLSVHRFRNGAVETTRLLKLLGDGESYFEPTLGFTATMTAHSANTASVSITFPSDVTDSDGDGVTDYREGQDGTGRTDAGSYLNHLSTPVFVLWNSFLGMVNIAELINPSSDSISTVKISLFAIDGELVHSQELNLNAGEQFDLILNQLPGFVPNSYGLVKIEYTGTLDGRVSYYRPNGPGYEFAYSIAFNQPIRGRSSVGFNTFQPSTNPSEAAFAVYNWLSLINLSGSVETYAINTYNQAGALLVTRSISVPPFGRADIDGGHGFAGPGVVGLHEIVPQHNNRPYIAQLVRYGSNSGPGENPSNYFFAFPLSARAGNGRPIMLPTSHQFNEANWIEIANVKNVPVNVSIKFYNANGSESTTALALAPHAQAHLNVDPSRLADEKRGYVHIDSDTPNSIVAQSMFYYRDTTGMIKAMYGIEPRESLGSKFTGSYNLFLGMENWLSLSSTSAEWVIATVQTNGPGGGSTRNYAIAPFTTMMLPIHSTGDFHTAPDSYGSIRVTPDRSNSIIADLTRMRRPGAEFDFAFPTAMRP